MQVIGVGVDKGEVVGVGVEKVEEVVVGRGERKWDVGCRAATGKWYESLKI